MQRLILFSLMIMSSNLFSQSFGEVGTCWQHCFLPDIEPQFFQVETKSVAEVKFDSLDCFLIELDSDYGLTEIKEITICNIGNQTYFVENDSLQLLYDFDLEPGDTFAINLPELLFEHYAGLLMSHENFDLAKTPGKVIIDSIEIIEINGTNLKRQHFIYIGPYNYVTGGRYATEYLGFEYFIFPYISVDYAEINPYSDLISYSDNYIQYDSEKECTTSANQNLSYSENLKTFPNPVNDNLYFDNKSEIREIQIYDSTGNLTNTYKHPISKPLNLSRNNSGVFFIRFIMSDYSELIKRIIKI